MPIASPGADDGLRSIMADIEKNLAGPLPPEAPPAAPDLEVEAAPAPDPDPEAQQAPLEALADAGPEVEAEAETQDSDGPYTTEDLAAAFEMTPEEFETRFVVSVDGVEKPLTVAELRRQAKSEGELTKRAQEVSEERRAAAEERQRYHAQLAEAQRYMASSWENAQQKQQALQQQMHQTNWQQIEAERGAAGVMEFRQAYEQMIQEAAAEQRGIEANARKLQEAAQQEAANHQQQAVQHALRTLPDVVPEWADEARRNQDITDVIEHLVNERGFKREQAVSLIDPREISLAYDAMRYRKLQSGAKNTMAEKKVSAKVAKAMRPAVKRKASAAAADRLKKIKSNLRQSGSVNDLAALRMEGFRKAR